MERDRDRNGWSEHGRETRMEPPFVHEADPGSGATGARARKPAAENAVHTVDAIALLGPSGLLRIDLAGEIYTLRLTRNHRLILTK